jgi:hypothetical protein
MKRFRNRIVLAVVCLVAYWVFGPPTFRESVKRMIDEVSGEKSRREAELRRIERQVDLEFRGVYAFGDLEVQQTLKIAAPQKEELQVIITNYDQRRTELFHDPVNRYLAELRAALRLGRILDGEGDGEVQLPRFVVENAHETAWARAHKDEKKQRLDAWRSIRMTLNEDQRRAWKALRGVVFDSDEEEIWK